MIVEEVHGIFQFADDLFPVETRLEQWKAPDYRPKYIEPQVSPLKPCLCIGSGTCLKRKPPWVLW
jgi:hypothetical protein